MNGWMDGYFINPEGNLGHPVAYTLNLTHKHTYTNHCRKTIHIGRTCSQGVGCIQILYRYYSVQKLVVSVLMFTRKVVQRVQRDSVHVLVWIVQGLSTCACVCEDSAK